MLWRVSYPFYLKSALGLAWLAIIALLAFPIAPKPVRLESAATLYDVNDEILVRKATKDNYWRYNAKLEKIDPNYIKAVLAIEDARFFLHSGVDVPAILRALKTWRAKGEVVSGASTITMQLVRQYKPRKRVLSSKIIESLAALKYELVFTKSEILSQYLTRISYGGNIQGVEAATWRYFGKSPEYLTWDEIALLVALPQAPESRRPDRHPVAAKAGRDRLLDKLVQADLISKSIADEAKSIPIPQSFYDFPSDQNNGAPLLRVKGQDVKSFIKPNIQRMAHRVLQNSLISQSDAVNASILVVENDTRRVVAHVTAGDRAHEGGWLDLTAAVRSPGSTLKPFIYALAMSDGQANSQSAIQDAPTRFGAYQPENFNRRYYGKVRLKDALKHSLNVPAVAALEQIGPARFEAMLVSAGAPPRLPSHRTEDAGLSLALGGAGMTGADLAVLYTALANEGVAKPLVWTKSHASSENGIQLFSAETAQEITEILAEATPPNGRIPGHLSAGRSMVAYKTGTSYGARDSWAAGYTTNYTVVAWVGRPDGAPRPGDTGRKSAAPLLFDVFDGLEEGGKSNKFAIARNHASQQDFQTTLDQGPQITFPMDGAEILVTAGKPTVKVKAQSVDRLRFYIDGHRLDVEYGAAEFRPPSSGFYILKVVDSQGKSAISRFRVLGADDIPNTPL